MLHTLCLFSLLIALVFGKRKPKPSYSDIPSCGSGNVNDSITFLPGWDTSKNGPLPSMYSGFIQVNESANGSLFYWFIESQTNPHSEQTPILLWLNGGPGASSLTGLLMENGPFRILNNNGNLELMKHNASWNMYYHMLFVDNPIGTGFSFCNSNGYITEESQMAEDFLIFLQKFFSDCHPKFKNNPFYITGESYAGRYIPFIAKWIESNDTTGINLKGLAIGDGIWDPFIQFKTASEYAYNLGILDEQGKMDVDSNVSTCLEIAQTGKDLCYAADICLNATNQIYNPPAPPRYNYGADIFQYNIYIRDPNYFNALTADIAAYLNQTDISNALHTYNVPWKSSDGTSSPNQVDDHLCADIVLNNSAAFVPDLLKKYRILYYNGQLDGSICNNIGNQRCLQQLNYENDWYNRPRKVWKTMSNGQNLTAGYVKQSKDQQLTYLVLSDSGHLVPYDQPENALAMIRTFVDGKSW